MILNFRPATKKDPRHYTFTPNGRREFVPRDQVFRLLFIASTIKVASFMPVLTIGIVRTVFICLFSIVKNSQLESEVCRLRS